MIALYETILRDYIVSIWRFCLIPLTLVLVAFVAHIIKNRKKLKSQKTRKGIFLNVFLLLGIVLIGAIHTVPAATDIRQNAVIVAQYKSAYYYNQSYLNDEAFLGRNPIMVVLSDGTHLELGDTSFDFPFEMENGTIIYAKHSKIILEYSGTIIHEDHF